jgi:predicted dehydrogenase
VARSPAHAVSTAWDLLPHDLAVLLYWLGRLPTAGHLEAPSERDVTWRGFDAAGPQLTLSAGYSPSPHRELVVESRHGTHRFSQRQTAPEPLAAVLAEFIECITRSRPPRSGAAEAAAIAQVLNGGIPCHTS